MSGQWKRRGVILGLAALALLAMQVLLPFGLLPRPATPNCGPERWRWLGQRFAGKDDVIAYLQQHELELLSGSHTPRLEGFAPDWIVQRMDAQIDWPAIARDIRIQQRPGYRLYSLTYHHPACSPHQSYTFRVTSYGLASLYGCCGA